MRTKKKDLSYIHAIDYELAGKGAQNANHITRTSQTDRQTESGGAKEPLRIRWGCRSPMARPILPRHARRQSVVKCVKAAEPIEMPFGLWTWVSQRKHVLREAEIPMRRKGQLLGERTCPSPTTFCR